MRKRPVLFDRMMMAAASYQQDEFAFLRGTSAIRLAQTHSDAFETQIKASGAPYAWLSLFKADEREGDASLYRNVMSAGGNAATGSFMLMTRTNPTGEARVFCRTDAGVDLIVQTPIPDTAQVVYDGDLHSLHVYDTAAAFSRTIKAKVDSNAVTTLYSGYSSAGIGNLRHYSLGFVSGATPVFNNSLFGWYVAHILVLASMEADAANIQAAIDSAKGWYAKGHAMIDAVEAAGHSADIEYAHVFRKNEPPRYGLAPTYKEVEWRCAA